MDGSWTSYVEIHSLCWQPAASKKTLGMSADFSCVTRFASALSVGFYILHGIHGVPDGSWTSFGEIHSLCWQPAASKKTLGMSADFSCVTRFASALVSDFIFSMESMVFLTQS